MAPPPGPRGVAASGGRRPHGRHRTLARRPESPRPDLADPVAGGSCGRPRLVAFAVGVLWVVSCHGHGVLSAPPGRGPLLGLVLAALALLALTGPRTPQAPGKTARETRV